MLNAIRVGFETVRRATGLVVLLWAVNLACAALLAIPLAATLAHDLEHTAAASRMATGFDFPWWSHWHDEQSGYGASFQPGVFGPGLAFANLDRLLNGELPAGLFAGAATDERLDGLILGLGVAYMLLQAFLVGGVLAQFRAPGGGWTIRGLFHGAGFYCGRMLRVTLVALAVHAALFAINAPLARLVDHRAAEAVSETTALALTFGRRLALLAAVLLVHMVAGYAKVIVVVEERSSAVLAFASALGFCGRFPARTIGIEFGFAAAGLVLLAAWSATGPAGSVLLLAQLLVVLRIGLRTAQLASTLALYRATAASELGLI